MISEQHNIKNLEELNSFAKSFAEEIKNQDQTNNTVLLLEGGMGTGKTTFTSAFGKALGIQARITSPTFIGINIYSSDIDLYHYDCYQVNPCPDGTLEILDNERKKVLVFEWSENLKVEFLELLQKKTLVYKISFELADSDNNCHPEGEANCHPEGEARRISIIKVTGDR